MTRPSETTLVGQALAACCLEQGVAGVTSAKMSLEFAFGHAWRNWRSSGRFRFVKAGLDRNDVLHIFSKSQGRRGVVLAAWVQEGPFWTPYLLADNDLDDAEALIPQYEPSIRWQEWQALADLFIGHFRPEEVQRC